MSYASYWQGLALNCEASLVTARAEVERQLAENTRLRAVLRDLEISYQDDDNFRRVLADLKRDYRVVAN